MQSFCSFAIFASLREIAVMNKDNKKIDIINEVLEDCIIAYPVSSFIISLYKQYGQRGFLSKKQLQGLYSKASAIKNMSTARIGTLEAIIKKMPTRYKSEVPPTKPFFEKDEGLGQLISAILQKAPQHKSALSFKSKYENNELLSPAEVMELKKFLEILEKKVH